jgi:hypothetical protein
MLFWALEYSFGNILTLKYFDQPQRDQSGSQGSLRTLGMEKKELRDYSKGKTTSHLHRQ